MTFFRSLLILSCVAISGCHHTELRQRALALRKENEELRAKMAEMETDQNQLRLVHLVWFKLKPELTDDEQTEFAQEIRKLNQIEFVRDLEIGSFAELGDSRAMNDLQLVMGMNFRSEQEYRDYQAHPVHLALKDAAGKYLAGPPVTYDYWTSGY